MDSRTDGEQSAVTFSPFNSIEMKILMSKRHARRVFVSLHSGDTRMSETLTSIIAAAIGIGYIFEWKLANAECCFLSRSSIARDEMKLNDI